MITLSNGSKFDYMAASGTLGFDGEGWTHEQPLRIPGLIDPWLEIFDPRLFMSVTKTLTPQPTPGNPYWDSIRFTRHGVVNAVALKNPGLDWWCKHVGPKLERKPPRLIVSITADDPGALALMVQRLDRYNIAGIEFNPSCPNIEHDESASMKFMIDGCWAIKSATRKPLILKPSVEQQPEGFLPYLGGTVEAFNINSVPWRLVYPKKASPLKKYGGGAVSGGAAQDWTWPYMERLARMTHIPVIGPSVWWYDDLRALRDRGAKAISFGSIWLRYPWKPTLYVRWDTNRAEREKLKKLFLRMQKLKPLHI